MLPLALAVLLAPPPLPPDQPADLTEIRPALTVLSDGKKHFVVVPIKKGGGIPEPVFYGDGKAFWMQRLQSGGRNGDDWDRTFWDPRVSRPYKRSVGLRAGKYTVQCEDRVTELKEVPAAEARQLIDGAKFWKVRWKRQAYALGRDDSGRYYYVDRLLEPENNKSFRLFAGPKGALKLQKMTNVVSDSEGDIFATRDGQLRLILDKREYAWIAKKTKVPLVPLPIEDNHALIYSDLGVYAGEPLGTPCDDL
jgi:hypothetical protein